MEAGVGAEVAAEVELGRWSVEAWAAGYAYCSSAASAAELGRLGSSATFAAH